MDLALMAALFGTIGLLGFWASAFYNFMTLCAKAFGRDVQFLATCARTAQWWLIPWLIALGFLVAQKM